MSENDFSSLEKEIIKSLKKEVLSKDDIEFGYFIVMFLHILMLFLKWKQDFYFKKQLLEKDASICI